MMKFANNYFIYLPVYQLFNGRFIRSIYYRSITKSDEEPVFMHILLRNIAIFPVAWK